VTLRAVRIAVARIFALVPRRFRFAVARVVAIAGAPIASRFAPPEWRDLNSGTDIALWALLRSMNRDRIEFDPSLSVDGIDVVDEARASGRGLLLISGHFRLNLLLTRWLRDRGWRSHVVRQDPEDLLFIHGTREKQPYFLVSPHVLLSVRRALADGDAVIIDVDSTDPVAHGFTIDGLHVSDAAPRAAARWNTTMAFLETRTNRGARVHAKITRGTADDLRGIFERWMRFRHPERE